MALRGYSRVTLARHRTTTPEGNDEAHDPYDEDPQVEFALQLDHKTKSKE